MSAVILTPAFLIFAAVALTVLGTAYVYLAAVAETALERLGRAIQLFLLMVIVAMTTWAVVLDLNVPVAV